MAVYEACRLPEGNVVAAADFHPDGFSTCIRSMYERQRNDWLGRLNGDALQEAQLMQQAYVQVQQALIRTGFLPANSVADGVLGPGTRAAIGTWQASVGLPPTGFVDKASAQLLLAPPAGAAPKDEIATEQVQLSTAQAQEETAKAEAAKAEAEAKSAEAQEETQRLINERQQAGDQAAQQARAEAEAKAAAAEQARDDAQGPTP